MLADEIIALFDHSAISADDYQRELHSGHMLIFATEHTTRPADVKPGWMWCVKRGQDGQGCGYTTPSHNRCNVHGRMDACWAEAPPRLSIDPSQVRVSEVSAC